MSATDVLADTIKAAVAEALREHQGVPRRGLTVAQAAQSIGKSERYVRRLIEDGELHARKSGPNGHLIVPVAALDAWLMDGAA